MKTGCVARICAVALAVTMGSGALRAEPSGSAKVEAEEAYRRGQRHLNNKEYDQAIAQLKRAYELDPVPEHLFNLGVAYHLKGDKEAAYEHYSRVLAAEPKDRELVRNTERYMRELESLLLAERKQEIERLRAALAKQTEVAKDAREEAQLLRRERSLPGTTVVVAEREGGRSAVIASMSMAAVGMAMLSAGLVYALEARSAHSELDELGEGDVWSASREWLHERGGSAERNAIVLSIGGGLCVAGGAAVYWYRGRNKERRPLQREISIVPVLGPTGAGAGVIGRF